MDFFTSYNFCLNTIFTSYNLKDRDRKVLNPAINGGRIIEIPGVDAAGKADILAEKLRAVLGPDVVVARPMVKGKIRIVGFDDTISTEEVVSVVSN